MTQQKINIIDYDKFVENSLRYVVKQTIEVVEKNGLPGEHHFYITFLTKFKGVIIPKALLKTYPNEMTIVIQHQFHDLKLTDDSFSITLNFNNISHNLTIPYNAITYFADPYAKFGLKFNNDNDELSENEEKTKDNIKQENADWQKDLSSKVVALDSFRKK